MNTNKEVIVPIKDVLNYDAFEVHNLMFTVREIIQCCYLMSNSLYVQHKSDSYNAYVINIKRESANILITACTIDKSMVQARTKNVPQNESLTKITESINTCTISESGDFLMFASKGFIDDNFTVCDAYTDFSLDDEHRFIMVNKSDIESMTNDNPTLL